MISEITVQTNLRVLGLSILINIGFLYNAQMCSLDYILSGKSTDRSPFSSQKNTVAHVYIPSTIKFRKELKL